MCVTQPISNSTSNFPDGRRAACPPLSSSHARDSSARPGSARLLRRRSAATPRGVRCALIS
eukprot:8007113-Pyramimonas_sp.AAC.1